MILTPKEKLVAERIYLQKPDVTFEYAYKMFEAVDQNRSHVLPWLEWALPEKTKRAEDDFIFALEADKDWREGKRFEYAIYDKKTDEYLGGLGVMMKGEEKNKRCEIGFWLVKHACGQGLMQEALKLVEDEFFSLGLERLVIRNVTENIKSKHVAERAGYCFEGVQRHGSYSSVLKKFRDVNVFSKISEQK